ncbi:hypothetical protein [Ktedonobacter racemifer]|uniref:Uncharacterized protein n=1 Tax=Ktedonobacter racemifer DSM 44963 TaxID=485913 RepID=D6U8R8_KTERA|nr:hypothetical protein [Ktedonobacter racemifer]EFH79628.1 hypothetical protein Krac_0106 [Ktedonobacter racemifer DSM 44963]
MEDYSSYRSYESEAQRRAKERETAPKTCPHCHEEINQNLGPWDKPKYHCGKDKCRKAASRQNIAERKRQNRANARERMLKYCEQHLTMDQRRSVMDMCDLLMNYSYDEGHQIAEQVVKVIEEKRCKHDRIAQLEAYAKLANRQREASERQLKERIAELEEELRLYQSLENTIHGIAERQLEKQPDPQKPEERPAPQEQEEESDPDRARVPSILAQANIKPYTGQEEEEEEEGEELGEYSDEGDEDRDEEE